MLILTTSILLGLTSLVASNPIQIRQDSTDARLIFKPETLATVDLYTAGLGVSGIVAYTSPKGDGVLTFENRSVAGDPITPDTHFAIASNLKLFLGTVLVMLSERNITLDNGNVWGLDTPLKDFVPGFKMFTENATELATTNDFLAHRTGLPTHNFAIHPQDTPKIWMERLAYLRPNTPFRQTWTYSNTNYAAITYVVELLTGKSYYNILDEYIFQPLKMDSSSDYAAQKAGGAEVSEGWLRNGINSTTCFTDILAVDPSTLVLPPSCVGDIKGIEFWTEGSGQEWGGGGNVIATRMIWYTKEILNPTIIPASVFERIETVTFPNTSRPGQGYTIGTVQSTFRGYNTSSHDGALPGSNSNFIRIRNESIGVFSLSTDDTYGTAWYLNIQNLILDDLLDILPAIPDPPEPVDSVLPTPPPANPRPIDNSTFIGSSFLAPGYAPFTLSTLDLTDSGAVSEAGFTVDFLLLDIATLSSLTFAQELLYTRWNQTAAEHLVFTHFDGPLYNVTALTSWPQVDGDGVVGKWWGGPTAVFEMGELGSLMDAGVRVVGSAPLKRE